jgi:hypothetical protein
MTFRLVILILLIGVTSTSQAQVIINEICATNADIKHDPQYFNFSGWVELFNTGNSSVNIGGFYLSDDAAQPQKWRIPGGTSLAAKNHLLIWCDEKNAQLHTNFSLDSDGGTLILSNASATKVDQIDFPEQYINVSYGRQSDGSTQWGYLILPTASAPNTGIAGTERLTAPTFSLMAGRYSGAQSTIISHTDPAVEIRITTDGSEPTQTSTALQGSLSISKTMTVKAKAFKTGFIPSKTEVSTYFINEHSFTLPVISISTKPDFLWDNTIGIYTDGTNGTTGNCQNTPFNWNRDWSRHAVLEFFDHTGRKQFDQSVDLRIGGACSRSLPSKSFAIKARDEYGKNTINQRLFTGKEWNSYGGFMLRNSGNDFWNTMFRDALMQSTVADQMDIDYMAYDPKIIYLNGEYRGILNLREKIDADYFKTNYGVEKEDLDLGEWQIALEGSVDDYLNYLSTLATMNLTTPEAFDYIDSNIDVQEFINYLVTEIYYCNTDWPGNNVKFWRQRSTNGKWRWILWDLDFGMALYTDRSYPTHPTLNFATATNGPEWPNPPWSTQHLRLLLQNPEFKAKFIQTFTSSLSSTFKPERVIEVIDKFQNVIKNEMPFHTAKWNPQGNWNFEVKRLRDFALQRNDYMRTHLASFFGLSDNVGISISAAENKGGFTFNGISSQEALINGAYFRGLEYTIEADPLPGYVFSHWNITKRDVTPVSLISRSSLWKFFDDGIEPALNWESESYDDAAWQEGAAQLGYGENDEQTIVSYGSDPNNKYITTYFRKSIVVDDTVDLSALAGKILFDDGVVVYLNGEEVYRKNLPDGTINYNTLALVAATENVYESFSIPKGKIKPGLNLIAVELHQNSTTSSDISFDLELSTGKVGQQTNTTSSLSTITDVADSDVTMQAFFIPVEPISGLIINEFAASETEHADEKGENEDWIEVYHKGTEAIQLGGLYITDDVGDKRKYQLKDKGSETIIQPGEYKILYADEELFDGPLHVNFKLSDEGESIALYQMVGDELRSIDQVTFEEDKPSSSYSRIPDINGPFLLTTEPTPLSPNIYKEFVVASEPQLETSVTIHPNPSHGSFHIQSSAVIKEVKVFTITGQRLNHFFPMKPEVVISLDQFSNGLYLIEIVTENIRVVKKVVKGD